MELMLPATATPAMKAMKPKPTRRELLMATATLLHRQRTAEFEKRHAAAKRERGRIEKQIVRVAIRMVRHAKAEVSLSPGFRDYNRVEFTVRADTMPGTPLNQKFVDLVNAANAVVFPVRPDDVKSIYNELAAAAGNGTSERIEALTRNPATRKTLLQIGQALSTPNVTPANQPA